MSRITTLDLARENLFSPESELANKFGEFDINRIMKVRAMYMWRLSNPEMKDRQFIDEFRSRYPEAGKNVAHEYMVVVNTLLPALSEKAREFHRWRYNEMILETYQMAKARKDTKTMERAATSYGRLNNVDAEETQQIPWDIIRKQPFIPTMDPSVLGITPIPDIDKRIKTMIDKYIKETRDIVDVDYEEIDLEEDELFAPYDENDED